jgi:hypothetical protein
MGIMWKASIVEYLVNGEYGRDRDSGGKGRGKTGGKEKYRREKRRKEQKNGGAKGKLNNG